jgi:hypothetical protein
MTDPQSGRQRGTRGMKAADDALGNQEDALGHQEVAAAIYQHIINLPTGSVVSVQGSWGRGKTDVVKRVRQLFEPDAPGSGPEPIWINPWQYGRPDLIQPIVLVLMERMSNRSQVSQRLRDIAKSLLHAGSAMAFKAASVVVPFGEIIGAAEPAVDGLIDDLMKPADQRSNVDADPVREMAERFCQLVQEFLEQEDNPSAPLLICVDDLDRCLPDHQIAMLEAIYFLTSAEANCSFLVALDPVLVQQAAIIHYGTEGFDSNQYLDKLFDLRVNLPALRPDKIEALVDAELRRPLAGRGEARTVESLLREGLEVESASVKAAVGRVFFVPELANPRLVHRVFWRLRLAASLNIRKASQELRNPDNLYGLIAWCAIAERWPQVRQMLEASEFDQWATNLSAVCNFYGIWHDDDVSAEDKAQELEAGASITSRLPGRFKQPDLGFFIEHRILPDEDLLAIFKRVDDVLVPFGL